jgi:hypothetical protein
MAPPQIIASRKRLSRASRKRVCALADLSGLVVRVSQGSLHPYEGEYAVRTIALRATSESAKDQIVNLPAGGRFLCLCQN